MRAIEFIVENVHKTNAIYGADADAGPLQSYSYGSRTVNNRLHNHYRGMEKIHPSSNVAKHIKDLDRVIAKFTLSKPVTVYSGIPVSVLHAYDTYKADKTKPIKLHLPAYTSTSTSLIKAAGFSLRSRQNISNVLLIKLPAGTPAVSVKNVSIHHYENEVLLPRGMNIEVEPKPTVIDKNGRIIHIWNAKALGHSPIEIFSKK